MTSGELNKKQPVLSALGDIVSQLTKMADESVMGAVDEAVKQLGDQLNDLLEQMDQRKTHLQVGNVLPSIDTQSTIVCLQRSTK